MCENNLIYKMLVLQKVWEPLPRSMINTYDTGKIRRSREGGAAVTDGFQSGWRGKQPELAGLQQFKLKHPSCYLSAGCVDGIR